MLAAVREVLTGRLHRAAADGDSDLAALGRLLGEVIGEPGAG